MYEPALQRTPVTIFDDLKWNNPSQYDVGFSLVAEFPPDCMKRRQHQMAVLMHRRGVIGLGCQRRAFGNIKISSTPTAPLLKPDIRNPPVILRQDSVASSELSLLSESSPSTSSSELKAYFTSSNADFIKLPNQTLTTLAEKIALDQASGYRLRRHTSATPPEPKPEPESDMGWQWDPSNLPDPNGQPMDFMRQLEEIGWNGGENNFDGKHDEFCFVCGGSMELFGCQTCEICYHASCMSPTLEPDDVPSFWFCPHCVDLEFHVPPDLPAENFTAAPSTQPAAVYPSPASITTPNDEPKAGPRPSQTQAAGPRRKRGNPEGQMISIAESMAKVSEVSRSLAPKIIEARSETKANSTKVPVGRPRRSYSPPRKRSKYSAFSSEVDKALAVINKELESAAQKGKSEDSLREQIQTLEQELRLKDGQITLMNRELEMAKKNGEATRLKAENRELKEENDSLKALVEKKDGELRDWRTKLKTLLGNDIE
ncbi:uncharacterized protein PAC_07586 [Phialocephala subalpina]|uniref:PHD-type domain-containing protein n=1 Tax=Phialocephala subalpina TaxID=576137 RepID=A0A1L7WY52_9HELO|nr:uncharacterized protein PAC_07586 [Phialocephala subalpina]